MKRAKKTKTEARKAGGVSLERVWMLAFLGAFVVILGLSFFLLRQGAGDRAELQHQRDTTVANGYVGALAATVGQNVAILKTLAHDPTLLSALAAGDAETLHAREAALAPLFPGASRTRLLPPGLQVPDTTTTPPLGYACLDMLHRAEASQHMPPAEVHLPGTKQQHVDMVQALKGGDGRAVGTVLVSFPVSLLKQTLRPAGRSDGGHWELRQDAVKGSPVVLVSGGASSATGGSAPVVVSVPGTRWQLAYWPAGPATTLTAVLLSWAPALVAVVLLGGLLFAFYRVLSQALRKDQVAVIKMLRDIADGNIPARQQASLSNCQGLLEQVQVLGQAARPERQKAPPPTPEPASILPEVPPPAIEVEEVLDIAQPSAPRSADISPSIFRAYDIRGVVEQTLTADAVHQIGRAVGSEAADRGASKVVVARDGRLSGPALSQALIGGLTASGCDVVDIGRVPTPVLYFAAQYLGGGSGVVVTGSHNPPEYNGLKIMVAGETLYGDGIQALRARIDGGNLLSGEGQVQTVDVLPGYIERITGDVRLQRPLKVAVDCGNGVAGEVAPQLLRVLGCEVLELFCDVDGSFPNHHPDPSKPENLMPLMRAVREHKADLGIAFDGDGDRLGVVDSQGKIIWPDRLLMLLAADVLLRQPGSQVIYDVKCSRHLERVIVEHGGQPLMSRTGHSFIKAKMQETGAQLAGEMSGHIFFEERWFGFDDGIYAAARLLEILAADPRPSSEVFADLPESVSTPELTVGTAEGAHFRLMQRLLADARFGDGRLITVDGLRVEYEDGWGLVRASNTTPCLVLRFEADDEAGLRRIQEVFRQQLLALDPNLQLPF